MWRTGCVVGAAIAVWLVGAGAARAGGAGADLSGAQNALDDLCGAFGVSNCPKLPTLNQLVIENSAIGGSSPADVRAVLNLKPGAAIDAGTAFAGNPVVGNPLAFVSPSNKTGAPIPTQPSDPAANAFLSATTDLNTKTLNLVFDYRPRTISTFGSGQDVGDIVLPMAVVDTTGPSPQVREPVPLTVQIRGPLGGGSAVTTAAVGDLKGTGTPQTFALSKLGMTFSLDFSQGNAVFDLGIPLIGFDNLLAFDAPGFAFDTGLFDGIDPIANFLDASFVNDANDPPAFHADLAIAFDGTTLLSGPVPAPDGLVGVA